MRFPKTTNSRVQKPRTNLHLGERLIGGALLALARGVASAVKGVFARFFNNETDSSPNPLNGRVTAPAAVAGSTTPSAVPTVPAPTATASTPCSSQGNSNCARSALESLSLPENFSSRQAHMLNAFREWFLQQPGAGFKVSGTGRVCDTLEIPSVHDKYYTRFFNQAAYMGIMSEVAAGTYPAFHRVYHYTHNGKSRTISIGSEESVGIKKERNNYGVESRVETAEEVNEAFAALEKPEENSQEKAEVAIFSFVRRGKEDDTPEAVRTKATYYRCFQIDDQLTPDNLPNFIQAIDEVVSAMEEQATLGRNIHSRCTAGTSRSATAVICYLMKKRQQEGQDFSYDTVLREVAGARAKVKPNVAEFLVFYEHYLQAQQSDDSGLAGGGAAAGPASILPSGVGETAGVVPPSISNGGITRRSVLAAMSPEQLNRCLHYGTATVFTELGHDYYGLPEE